MLVINYLSTTVTPLMAGFLGGVLTQVVILLLTRGPSDTPRAVRIQLVLLWMIMVLLIVISVSQSLSIRALLEAQQRTT